MISVTELGGVGAGRGFPGGRGSGLRKGVVLLCSQEKGVATNSLFAVNTMLFHITVQIRCTVWVCGPAKSNWGPSLE